MRILFVSRRGPTNADRKGGAQEYVLNLSIQLQKKGCEILILCGAEKINDNLLPNEEQVKGINVLRISSSKTKPLIKKVKALENQFDVVIENIMAFGLNLPLYLSKNIPFFVVRHHLQKKNFFKLQGAIKGFYGIVLESFTEPLIYKNTSFIAASNLTRQEILNRWLKPKSISVINPGYDFIVKDNIKKEAKPTIFFVGHLVTARKKVNDLIIAFKKVVGVVKDAQLWIAGEGPDKNELVKLSTGLPVKFLGFLNEEKKHECYQQSWIFSSPSVSEGFGITWIEANAHGLPVVAYELGLNTVNKDCAIMVNAGEIDQLSKALISLLENNDLRQRMSEAAIENAKRFSWQASGNQFYNLLETEIEKNRKILLHQ